MKKIFFLLIFSSLSTVVFAQDTTLAFINNRKAGKCISKEGQKPCMISIKKTCFKKYKSFIIQVKGKNISGTFYNRELEITGDSSIIINELKDQPGKFDITVTNSKEILLSGKTLQLFLVLNPANRRMMAPSKRIYLCDLKTKNN